MVVTELDLPRFAIKPPKTKTPLIVYPNVVCTEAVALKTLEPITRRNPQVSDIASRIEHLKLAKELFAN